MKKLVLLLVLLTAVAFAANNAVVTGAGPINVHPNPPAPAELYWDDGILSSGWAWYTGGNYWAVQFDDTKTGGVDDGNISSIGAVTYPNWPDSTFQGAYIHIFNDLGGYPGSSVGNVWCLFTAASTYNWRTADIDIDTSVFYGAFMQFGNYPACDSVGVDAAAGTHDWTGYQGSWGASTSYGDFMVRVYWDAVGVENSTWGAVKALY